MDLCCYRHGILSLVFENISYIRKLTDGGIEFEEDGIKYTYHKKGGLYKEDNDLAPWFDLYTTDSSREIVYDDPEPEEDEDDSFFVNNRNHSYRDYDSDSYGYGGCGSGGCGGYTRSYSCGFGGCGGYVWHGGGCGGCR